MQFELERAIPVLERTPGALRALLSGLDDAWIRSNYGPDTFSPFDVVGHLIEGEKQDWIPRLRIILEHGPRQPFPTFDRYAMFKSSRGKSLADLLAEFDEARRDSLAELRSVNPDAAQLALEGRHAQLGLVTLSQLLATWVAHDLNHLHQIAKCMAWQYRDAIGPWRAYLGVLKDA